MKLDLSFWIGAIGLILTIYSIYLVLRRKKYPGKITLVKENSVGLFNELANNFEDIKIEFKGKPIDKNIIHIKGSFINDGENDLNLNDSEVPVGIYLCDELKWIKAKITKTSSNVNCKAEIENEQKLNFKCGYLKMNEFFQFEALIETYNPKFNSNNIFNYLDPKHRLINTQKIGVTSYLSEKQRQEKQRSVKSYMIYFLLIFMFFFGISAYKTYFTVSTEFEYLHENKLYDATPLTDNTIEIEGIDNDLKQIITVSEFKQKFTPLILKKTYWAQLRESIWFIVFMLLAYLLMIIWDILELRKSRQLSEIIEKGNENQT